MGNPTVRVAVNGNILKHYKSEVYLQDGAEFQLEINNPTKERLRAELSVNGKKESTALILRPGERIFLKRFLDADNKFIFSEYTIPGENSHAIAWNGVINVVFSKEAVYQPQHIGGWRIDGPYMGRYNPPPSTVSPFIYAVNTTGGYVKSLNTDLAINDNIVATGGIIEARNGNIGTLNLTNSVAPEIKTGIVEKGEQSGQEFNEIHDNIRWTFFSSDTVTILPLSRKPPEVQVRQYCPFCGAKVKSEWKFCPSCGKSI